MHPTHSKVRLSSPSSSVGSIRAINIGTPHFGQRRFPNGGGFAGLNQFGCGMARSFRYTGGSALISQSPTPVGRASAGDVGIWRSTDRKSQSAKILNTAQSTKVLRTVDAVD